MPSSDPDPQRPDPGLNSALFDDIAEGQGWMAVPFRVSGTADEIVAAAEAFNRDLGELLERHPSIDQVTNHADALACLEHGAAISRTVAEQAAARQARQN